GNKPIKSSPEPLLRRQEGFTLIELILVMAMLLIVLSVAFPSLKNFFRGRNLDSEARRFVSLTHYAQSRAVSEGIPMMLWIDTRRKTYGVQTQTGYTDFDNKAVELRLDNALEVQVSAPRTTPAKQASLTRQVIPGVDTVPMIRFTPDGLIAQTSQDRIASRQDKDDAVAIVL